MKALCYALCLTTCLSCSFYGSINLKQHVFDQSPQKIIWLHFAGLDEEHISLLKFFYQNTQLKTSFEHATCMGQAWRYNLYQLRPNHYASFLSQALGTQNITHTCQDYHLPPLWSYLAPHGYQTGILENVANPKLSLTHAQDCGQKKFLQHTVLWAMRANPDGHSFHAQKQSQFQPGKTYYDQSCSKANGCYHSLLDNIQALLQNYFQGSYNYLFIARDDTLFRYLSARKLQQAKNYLLEIERVFDYFVQLQKIDPDMLVLLTTSESLPVELPRRGREWRSFVAGKDNLIYHKSSTLSPVWALGVRAENFCGLYEEAEILRRTLHNFTPKRLHFLGIPLI